MASSTSRLLLLLCVILLGNICLAVGPPIYLNPDPEEPYPYCPDGYFRLIGTNVCRMDHETMAKYFKNWRVVWTWNTWKKVDILTHLFLFRLLNLAFLHSSNEQLSWSMMFLTKNLIEELPNRPNPYTGRYKAKAYLAAAEKMHALLYTFSRPVSYSSRLQLRSVVVWLYIDEFSYFK